MLTSRHSEDTTVNDHFVSCLCFQEMLRHWSDTRPWMELDWDLYWSRWACGRCIKTHTLMHTPQVDNLLSDHFIFNYEMLYFSHEQLLFLCLMVCATYLILSLSKFHIVKWSWFRLVAYCQACWDSSVVLVGCNLSLCSRSVAYLRCQFSDFSQAFKKGDYEHNTVTCV